MAYIGSATKSTLGPRGRGKPVSALGATPTTAEQEILRLQAQIGRFSLGFPMTGVLDQPTAIAAQVIIIQRFTRAFVEDPANKETSALFAEANKNLGNALPWVRANLVLITDTLRDFGDFIGKPPARGEPSRAGKAMLIVAAATVAAIFLTSRKGRRR